MAPADAKDAELGAVRAAYEPAAVSAQIAAAGILPAPAHAAALDALAAAEAAREAAQAAREEAQAARDEARAEAAALRLELAELRAVPPLPSAQVSGPRQSGSDPLMRWLAAEWSLPDHWLTTS